ncbi:MAG: S9 family peptidase [Acidobacteriaceae bacterium]|nr:S9 family peptidase [Acidobacteriaceae bacterium]
MQLWTLARFFLGACSLVLPLSRTGTAAFTVEQVMSTPFASGLIASPKGAAVAWLENEHGRRNIWVAHGPEWHARAITAFDKDEGQEIADLVWSPDGSYILFARGGDFENGGEDPNPDLNPKKPEQGIWRVNMDGGPPSKLTVGHAPQVAPDGHIVLFLRNGQIYSWAKPDGTDIAPLVEQPGSQSDLRWSPDGRSFAFVSNRKQHSFIGLYSVANRSVRYLDPSVDSDTAPVWSPDSTQIAFIRLPATNRPAFFSPRRAVPPWSIRVANIGNGTGREMFRALDGPGSLFHQIEATDQIFWTRSGRIVFPWERTGWSHLYSLPVAGGDPVELTPGAGEVEHVSASPDGAIIYFSTNIADIDRRHLASVASSGNEKTKPLTTGPGIEWQPVPVADGSVLICLASSYNQSAHPAVRLVNGGTRSIGPEPPSAFPARNMVEPEPVLITAADGLVIHGQLFVPPGQSAAGRHPALIFFHGGSRRQMLLGFHYMYYYSNAYALNQYLANRGYVVLSVNYRSGIGYGLNFREAVNYGAQGASEFNDVIGAGLYLKSRSDVDPSRIGVWGGSYGGYLTALALARASDLFRAGVDFHGVHDWSSLRGYLSSGDGSGDPNEVRDRQEAARIAFESSPMASVDTWRSPVLLIHGDDDRNVDFAQTIMLVEALRKRKVPYEELIFPNEIHDFLLHRHWVEAYQATADFFARKLNEPVQSAAK